MVYHISVITKDLRFMKKIFLFSIATLMFFNLLAQTKNGTFEGRSHSIYKNEPYKGVTRITLQNGKIQNVTFQIIDTSKNELFDQNYASHYPNQPEYQKQCVEDWKGVLNYPAQLLKKQNITSVDAVTGATWSYNLFVSSAAVALKKANVKINKRKIRN